MSELQVLGSMVLIGLIILSLGINSLQERPWPPK